MYLNDIYSCFTYVGKFKRDLEKKCNYFFKKLPDELAKTVRAIKLFDESAKELSEAYSVRNLHDIH